MTIESQDESGPAPATRTQKRALRTRRRLLDAARRAFCDVGVDATSIEDVTERADLGKGTFYRHFRGKDDILAALVDEALDGLVEQVRALRPPCPDARAAIETLLNVHIDRCLARRDEFLLLLQGRVLLKLDRDEEGELEAPYARYLDEVETYLAASVPGGVDAAAVRRVAVAVAGFVNGYFSFAMIGMDSEEVRGSLGQLRSSMVAGLLGLLGRGGARPPAPHANADGAADVRSPAAGPASPPQNKGERNDDSTEPAGRRSL